MEKVVMNINYFFLNSPQHIVDEMQSVKDTKHGSLLKKINASISITVKSINQCLC